MCNFVLQIIISGMISLKCWELLLLFLSLHLYLQIYTHDEEISFGVFSTCNFSHPTTCYSVFCIDHVKHLTKDINMGLLQKINFHPVYEKSFSKKNILYILSKYLSMIQHNFSNSAKVVLVFTTLYSYILLKHNRIYLVVC